MCPPNQPPSNAPPPSRNLANSLHHVDPRVPPTRNRPLSTP
ncbi:hypothetical protein L195_g061819, partial [Trifolium pratense]